MNPKETIEAMNQGFLVKADAWADGYYLYLNEHGHIVDECTNRTPMIDSTSGYKVCGVKAATSKNEDVVAAYERVKNHPHKSNKVFIIVEG